MPHRTPLGEETIKAFLEGSPEAYTVIYYHYRRFLWHWGIRELKNQVLVKDYVHDVFANLWKNRNTCDTDHFYEYLGATARDFLLKHRLQMIEERAIREDLKLSQAGAENSNNVELSLLAKDVKEHIDRKLDYLPARQKEIFKLAYDDGLSAQEIADRLGIEKQTVHNQLSRARDSLRGFFDSD